MGKCATSEQMEEDARLDRWQTELSIEKANLDRRESLVSAREAVAELDRKMINEHEEIRFVIERHEVALVMKNVPFGHQYMTLVERLKICLQNGVP